MTNTLKNNLSVDPLIRTGPGDYDNNEKWVNESRFKKSPSYGSVGYSTKKFDRVSQGGSIAPGPQQYNTNNLGMQTNGIHFFSKFKSSGACKINPAKIGSTGNLHQKGPSPNS